MDAVLELSEDLLVAVPVSTVRPLVRTSLSFSAEICWRSHRALSPLLPVIIDDFIHVGIDHGIDQRGGLLRIAAAEADRENSRPRIGAFHANLLS